MSNLKLRVYVRSVLREARGSSATETAKAAVRDYMELELPDEELQAIEDPSHSGVVAVRVTNFDNVIDFLVSNCDGTPDIDYDVAETEFKTWPPKRSRLGRPGF